MSVTAVVGAQYGSEGKGLVVSKIADRFDVHIRTGAQNAGHTYYAKCPPNEPWVEGMEKAKIVARSVPIGVINPDAYLIIGPGALVDIDLLISEVKDLERLGFQVTHRLFVDDKAIVVDRTRHHQFEGGIHGVAHNVIGSTGEGVGPARMAHMSRGTMSVHGGTPAWLNVDHVGDPHIRRQLAAEDIMIVDTSEYVNQHIKSGAAVLLEGTQGSGLSLTHGKWPFVTSNDTNAAQLLSDAGISPGHYTGTILVARTYPIRVAGNSGPLDYETTWDSVGVTPEKTTVTRKERRIGRWDGKLFGRAVRMNGPTPVVAITFMDYIFPEVYGMTEYSQLTDPVHEWIHGLEKSFDVRVGWVGTGPDSLVPVGP